MQRKQQILKKARAHVQSIFDHEGTGHDFWHIERVRKMALRLARLEKADPFVVELAALLHEMDDHKLVKGGHPDNPQRATAVLKELGVEDTTLHHVVEVIRSVSFRGAKVNTPAQSAEAKVVQDADRLDALGAIGIARTFTYGGSKHRPVHDPRVRKQLHKSFSSYSGHQSGTTINHFSEKLLLLKDRMQTRSGKKIAAQRHAYLKNFLAQFLREWQGK